MPNKELGVSGGSKPPSVEQQPSVDAGTPQTPQYGVPIPWEEYYAAVGSPRGEYRDTPVGGPQVSGITRWVSEHAAPWLGEQRTTPWGTTFTWSQSLDDFNRSPFGRAFAVLDVGAEFIERVSGFVPQLILEPGETLDHPSEAWRAATLAYDVVSTRRWGASISDIQLARNMLVGGATMEDVRGLIESRYGENAAREAMVIDSVLHLVADPLNIVLPHIRPIARAQAAARAAIWTRTAPELITEAAADVARITDELTDLERVGAAAGHLVGPALEPGYLDLATATGRLAELQGRAPTLFQRFSLWMTGGTPLGSEELTHWAARTQSVGLFDAVRAAAKGDLRTASRWGALPWNLFRLTPQSMATGTVQDLERFTGALMAAEPDPNRLGAMLQRVGTSIETGPLRALMSTPGGRAMASWLRIASPNIADLAEHWAMTAAQRADIAIMARLAGLTPDDFMGRLFRGQADDAWRLLERGITNPAEELRDVARVMGQRITEGTITNETLGALGRVFEGMPYTDELYRVHLLTGLADTTATAVAAVAGVRAGGFWMHAANSLRAAESLAYLGLNPGYYVRNLFNNYITMAARGTFNVWSRATIENMIQRMGTVDPRMFSGFGAAEFGEVAATAADQITRAFDDAQEIIGEAARMETNWVDRAINRVSSLVSPIDMRRYAAASESMASARAYMGAFSDEWRHFATPGAGYSRMSQELRTVVGEDFARRLERSVPGAWTTDELNELVTTRNLNATMGSVLDNMASESGVAPEQVRRVFGQDFLDGIAPRVEAAIATGNPEDVRTAFRTVFSEWQSHIDDLSNNTVRYERAFAAMQVEGPTAAVRLYHEGDSFINGAMDAHLNRLADEIPNIRLIEDDAIRHSAWNRLSTEQNEFWTRTQNWLNRDRQGMLAGARRAGITLDPSVGTATSERIIAARDFYTLRQRLWDEVFTMPRGAERDAAYAAMGDRLDVAYGEWIDTEGRLARTVDDAVGAMFPAGPQREMYTMVRGRAREIRRAYMVDMQAAYRQAAPMDAVSRGNFFDTVVGPRRREYTRAIGEVENQLRAALSGNPEAAAGLSEAVTVERNLAQRALAGERLAVEERIRLNNAARTAATPEQNAALDAFRVREEAATLNFVEGDLPNEWRLHGRNLESAQPGKNVGTYGTWGSETELPLLFNIEVIEKGRGTGEQALIRWMQELRLRGQTEFATTRLLPQAQGWWDEMIRRGYIEQIGTWTPQEAEMAIRGVEYPRFRIGDIPEEIATHQPTGDLPLWEDIYQGMVNPRAVPGTAGTNTPFFADARAIVQDQPPIAEGLAELWATDGGKIFRDMEDGAVRLAGERPIRFTDLSEDAQRGLRGYLATLQDEMPGIRMATMKMAEARRDAALLNYSRRTNFDTYLGGVMPFAFWTTHSVFNWMLHSLDRPAVLSTFLRMQRVMQMGQDRPGFPERMRGFVLPVNLPGAPAWMGSVYVDPLGVGLPFNQWQDAATAMATVGDDQEAQILRVLDSMRQGGQISDEDYQNTVQNKSGPYWDSASRQVSNGEDSWMDAFSLLTSPHAPLIWAYNAARGRPFQPGPFLPATRTIRSLTAMFGVGPAGGVNIEAGVRRVAGLPAFDEWDDYRVDRMLATMAADGYSPDDLRRAMIDRAGPLFEEATRRAGQQYAVQGIGSLIGVPMMAYPPGEEQSRVLMDELGRAADARDAGDTNAMQAFFDEHPEAEVRLAINKSPEQRLQQFVVDQIWSAYNELPDYTRSEIVDQFGPLFEQNFLNRDTRSYDAIPVEILGMWARALGADTPGRLEAGPGTAMALQLAPPDVANRIQVFYDTRDRYFENIYDEQEPYFQLNEGAARRAYLADHPRLRDYWNWRNDWLLRNPMVATYLTEEPPTYPSEQALGEAQAAQPNFQWAEWYSYLGPNLANLVVDWTRGEALPAAAEARLRDLADGLGVTYDTVLERLRASLATQQ